MKSVLLTKFVPYPDDSGGKKRSLAMAKALAAISDVTLCAFDDGRADVSYLHSLGIKVCTVPWRPHLGSAARGLLRTRSVAAARFFSLPLLRRVEAELGRAKVDLFQVEYSHLTPYLLALGGRAATTVLDLHNVESSLAQSYAGSTSGPRAAVVRLESRALARLERRALAMADVTVVVSDADRKRLPGSPRGEVLVCPNGFDPRAPLPMSGEPVVSFIALLAWRPNSDAAVWFARAVWPRVRARRPDARLLLVGREPPVAVRRLACASIDVVGDVPSVEPYLARTRVSVAPLLAGGGSRLKILEALGAGRPVVATRTGAEGLGDLAGRGVFIADNPEAFADEVVTLLSDEDRAATAGAEGHRAVHSRYQWSQVLSPLTERLITRCCSS